MKVSSTWIKEWLCRTMSDGSVGRTILSDSELVSVLEQAGIEVEQFSYSGELDKKIVVGLVKKVAQHPGADKLHLVQVAVGESEYAIVCGAPNVREGMKVALAQVGSTLPSGDRITKAKLRGEVSEGMLCSERELGLGNDHDGIMEVSSDVAEGTSLCDLYPAQGIIDIKTPANRFDLLGVMGLARDVAAMTADSLAPLTSPAVPVGADGPKLARGMAAQRFMLAPMTVRPLADLSPAPDWMTARLQAAGMRSVSPVVDVTNYVMLELAQPMHAYDAAKVKMPVDVRLAKAGETLVTLDGVERKLSPDDLVVTDAEGPIGLAGVMGGARTEVGPETTELLLEAAVFDAAAVRKAAKRHGLRTEASARFERGLPVALTPLAMARAAELLREVAGAELAGVAADQLNAEPEARSIELSLGHLRKLLGFDISHKEAVEALEKLQIPVAKRAQIGKTTKAAGESTEVADEMAAGRAGDKLVVPEVPWWRPDLKLAEDLVEEIVRVIGYERVPASIPAWRPQHLVFDWVRGARRRVRDVLYAAGLFEVMTYSFVSEEQLAAVGLAAAQHLKLKNPLSSEQAYLRTSLLPSHLGVLGRNRAYAREVALYEISNVFVKRAAGEQPDEPVRLALTVLRPEQSFRYVKGLLEAVAQELNVTLTVEAEDAEAMMPGRAGVVKLGGQVLGRIGQLHPEVVRAQKLTGEVAHVEVDLTPLVEAAGPRAFAGLMKFPTIQRDVALLVPVDVTWRMVQLELEKIRVRAEFVEDYHGAELPAGLKGLTLRLVVSEADRTPTEAEAVDLERKVVRRLERVLGARAR